MTWTSDKPTEPGWYVLEYCQGQSEPVVIVEDDGELWCWRPTGVRQLPQGVWREGWRWLGPFTAHTVELGAIFDEALSRSPYDVGECIRCHRPVVCLPDGMALCDECAALDNPAKP